ncbi:DoxX family protein [Paenibacillus sedimenti]|uniref:DoxX family protein n=1 Tax=Paenibacillus sedimenti TaxID=2770274 RepID=A0A926KW39_9BACL|nr:DoxX family protein [Paenibacillus sedimenti]MBD0383961.1 DoxX family protein [Paenibacillus sedimenti]
MHITSIVLQVILGLGFIMFGLMKFGAKQMVQEFQRYGYSKGFRIFTGLIELIGAAGMIVGIWNPQFAALAGILLAATMIGGIITHIRLKDPGKNLGAPFILLILSVVVAIMNLNFLV